MSETKAILGKTAAEIANCLRESIHSGDFEAGSMLPGIRDLAVQLNVNRNTVASAYQRLAQAGLMESDRRGSRVARRERVLPISIGEADFGPSVRDLSFGNPAPELLPDISTFIADAARRPQHLYGGLLEAPDLVAHALRHGDPAENDVAISLGAIDGLERVLMAHLRPGDAVAVEEPCFTRFIVLLRILGLVPIGMALDDEGPKPDALQHALQAGARACIITPTAQNPTGACLSEPRSQALAQVLAAHPSVIVIEDDHFGRLMPAPPQSLVAHLRQTRHWAILRSLSKCLGPDLRLAFLIGDQVTVGRVRDRQAAGVQWASMVLQWAAASALSNPSVQAAMQQAASIYTVRRIALLQALERHGVPAHGVEGLHVWVPLPQGEAQVAQYLLAKGWAVRTGELFRIKNSAGLRITTSILLPAEAERLAIDISQALYSPRRRSTQHEFQPLRSRSWLDRHSAHL